jgi:hypothetical protein
MSVEIARPETLAKDGGAGFRLGILSDVKDYRADCFTQMGFEAGLVGDELVLGTPRKARGRGAARSSRARRVTSP